MDSVKIRIRPARTYAVCLFWLLVACSHNDEGQKNTALSTRFHKGGTLVIGIPQDIDTFNPLFSETMVAQEIMHLVLLGLTDLDEHSQFSPAIATRWAFSDNGRKLSYDLQKNARWADGQPITARDVQFSFELLKDQQVGSPKREWVELIDKVEAPDSFRAVFSLKEPYPLSMFDTASELLPEHLLRNADRKSFSSHEFGRNPLASGPYRLKQWKPQQFIELEANRQYFGPRPQLEHLFFKVIPDENNLFMQLQTGEIDMAIDVPADKIPALSRANSHLQVYPVSGRLYYYLGYNEAHEKFAGVQVRRALTMAVDRQKMIDALLGGYGSICLGPIPPMISAAYNDTIQAIPYHPERAKELLAREGWSDSDNDGWLDKDGEIFQFTLNTDAANRRKCDVAVIIQDQLKQIGVKADIQLLEWANLLERLSARNFEAYIGGWNCPVYVDPTPVFHSTSTGFFNHGGYANPRVDQLIERGREEPDPQKAGEIWRELQAEIYYDQHYNFLFWSDRLVVVNKRFRNVSPIPLSVFYNIEDWYDGTAPAERAISSNSGE